MTYKELENLVEDLQEELGKLHRTVTELNGTLGVDLAPTSSTHPIYSIRAGSGIAGRLAEDLRREAAKIEERLATVRNHKDRIDDMLNATEQL